MSGVQRERARALSTLLRMSVEMNQQKPILVKLCDCFMRELLVYILYNA